MGIKSFKGALTVVTGAASGIGRAVAIAAADEGARLLLTDIDEAGLDDVVALIGSRGGEVLHHSAFDITDFEAVRAFADEVHERFGSVDVVMNIAGTSVWGTVENLEHRHWKKMVDVNLMGPIHVIECFVPSMIEAGRGGQLVNVSSAAGLLALPWHAAYSAAKFGVRGVSEVLRHDLKRHRIGVSLVVPGAVRTPLVDAAEIAGFDRKDPRIQAFTRRFSAHGITPELAAKRILAGVKRNRFLVYTSFDIRFGYWWARKFAPPYEYTMQKANDYFSKVLLPPV
ncbi:SDR family oxidoreductase [Rhodococcus sp. NPDC003382]|uniref:SDR family oxidoreductase n=1 Tax=unclassified Rhodococcus (in: high G+C Gram-positive bacteria) TaxID=192944 RepID=UPI0018CC9376|nr:MULTISPECIES: SDR family oxidoreductase [unclassified Rhodococcus (in: high G+C Gram-positive bacteria)]MBH0119695.1 SDR family oxidoreductase [Rhodococcus sp. CX]MCK8674479.1 SDR family oxidoreductase [Rhodococcus sp. HM1]